MRQAQADIRHLNWIRYLVGSALVILLMAIFLRTSDSIDNNAERTALAATVRGMQEQLNQYHNYWMVNKQPKSATIAGRDLQFDNKGWIVPLNNGKYDCNLLLELALKGKKVFGKPIKLLYSVGWKDGRSCLYTWGDESTYIEIEKRVSYTVSVKKLSQTKN
ncbi:hypothetical protein [Vibrio maerlii]|uniref:hypothetical protein n=1 Tax=Vibrio maerlii TaxID=2231648 RepID=UPI000E3E344B|nr:hypothetical protein [Vibrio maerlii]